MVVRVVGVGVGRDRRVRECARVSNLIVADEGAKPEHLLLRGVALDAERCELGVRGVRLPCEGLLRARLGLERLLGTQSTLAYLGEGGMDGRGGRGREQGERARGREGERARGREGERARGREGERERG